MVGRKLTICRKPTQNNPFLLPNLFATNGNMGIPMAALVKATDIMNVASANVIGPLGNVVLGFCSSRKLTEAQPFDEPSANDNRFPRNNSHNFIPRSDQNV